MENEVRRHELKEEFADNELKIANLQYVTEVCRTGLQKRIRLRVKMRKELEELDGK